MIITQHDTHSMLYLLHSLIKISRLGHLPDEFIRELFIGGGRMLIGYVVGQFLLRVIKQLQIEQMVDGSVIQRAEAALNFPDESALLIESQVHGQFLKWININTNFYQSHAQQWIGGLLNSKYIYQSFWTVKQQAVHNLQMNEQEDQFYVEPDVQQLQQPKPTPILDTSPLKLKNRMTESPRLRMLEVQKQPQFYLYRPFKFQRKSEAESQSESDAFIENPRKNVFTSNYNKEQCVYQRYDNSAFNTFNGVSYYSGQFANKAVFASPKCSETHEISDIMEQFYQISPPLLQKKDKNLIFDSAFEGGNLHSAYKMSDNQYDLIMSNDTNSTGSNQWFYFSVAGLQPGKQYSINIINFTKNDSLFNYGLTPAVFSLAENRNYVNQSLLKSNETLHIQNLEKGWKRKGKDVSYKKGSIQRQNSSRMYYKLSFKLSTNYEHDKLWISHSFPYSYSKLNKFIEDRVSKNREFVQKVEVGKSLSRRAIEGLIVCYQINKKRDNRKAVVIIARQHPGECQGSFVCQGVIDKLLFKSKQSELLLKNYVFYIIPMVNPDGVIFGHYRTNLAGKDLNRKWNILQKDTNCPEVTSIKSFLAEISKEREIRFILDLHGHSKKLNSFFYGNPYPQNPQVVKIFPFICGKLHPGIQYMDCTFSTEEQKRKAARVYLSLMYKLVHIYTFESSFYAYQKQGRKIQFTPKQYRQLGSALISGLFLQLEHEVKYQQSFEFSFKKYANNKEYMNSTFIKYINQLRNNKLLLEAGSLEESGSDSRPEEGQVNNQEIEYHKVLKVNTPTLVLDKDKQSLTKSMKGTRKLSQIKDYLRPPRNLKLLQISKINSVLPDKDQFCLQPTKKKQTGQPTTKLKALTTNIESQTEGLQNDFIIDNISEQQILKANLSNSVAMNKSAKKSAEPRSISLVKSYQTRNNIIFKLDFMNATSRNEEPMYTNRKKVTKHAFSQTLVSFNKINRLKELSGLPQLQKNEKSQNWPTSTQIKLDAPVSVTLLKKQTEVYISNMMRKIFANKQSEKHSEFSKRYMIDRNFNIKKKQLHRK